MNSGQYKEKENVLEISNTTVYNTLQAIEASGFPMQTGKPISMYGTVDEPKRVYSLGQAEAGSGHDNYLSGILVSFDVKYPLYWSPEFQRYHFAQIVSSQSTMHRLTVVANSDTFNESFNKYVDLSIIEIVKGLAKEYNALVEAKADKEDIYVAFMKLRSNLPSGYEMWMHVTTNYLQLKTIYKQRRNHKLKEDWGAFCDWIESLPMFMALTQKEKE